jgi:hypothetical protein
MKKFRDIAKDDIRLAGEKLKLQDIIGKTIIVTGYKNINRGNTHARIYNLPTRH